MATTIINLTAHPISIGSPIGSLYPFQTKTYNLSAHDLDKNIPNLELMVNAGYISWASDDGDLSSPAVSAPVNHAYLSLANGLDTNTGALGLPVKTWARVWQLLPTIQTSPFVVHVDGGDATTASTSYAWVKPPINQQIGERAFILVIGDGGNVGAHDGYYVVPGGSNLTVVTYNAGTASTFDDETRFTVAGPLAVDTFRRSTVEFLTGAAAGTKKHVSQNDATTIWPLGVYNSQTGAAVTVLPGDTFRVVRPNVNLDLTGVDYFKEESTQLYIINASVSNSGFATSRYNYLRGGRQWWYGVEIAATTRLYVVDAELVSGIGVGSAVAQNCFFPPAHSILPLIYEALNLTGVLDLNAWNGWGITAPVGLNHSTVNLTSRVKESSFVGVVAGGFLEAFFTNVRAFCTGFDLGVVDALGIGVRVDMIGQPRTRNRIDDALNGSSFRNINYGSGAIGSMTGTVYANKSKSSSTYYASGVGTTFTVSSATRNTVTATASQIMFQPEIGGRLHLSGAKIDCSGTFAVLASLTRGGQLVCTGVSAANVAFNGHTGIQVTTDSDIVWDGLSGAVTLTTSVGPAISIEKASRASFLNSFTCVSSVSKAGPGGNVVVKEGSTCVFGTNLICDAGIDVHTNSSLTVTNDCTLHGGYVQCYDNSQLSILASFVNDDIGSAVGSISGLIVGSNSKVDIFGNATFTGTGTVDDITVGKQATNFYGPATLYIAGTLSLSGNSAARLHVLEGGIAQLPAVAGTSGSFTGGAVLLIQGGEIAARGNLTITGSVAGRVPLTIERGGVYRQIANSLTATAFDTEACIIREASRLLATATPTLTGAAGFPGLHCLSGGMSALNSYASITEAGVGVGDIKLGALAAVVNTTVPALGNYNDFVAGSGSMMVRTT